MRDAADLAVHGHGSAHDIAAKGLTDGLVAEADATGRSRIPAVASYRAYYTEAKQALLKWKRRGPPQWIHADGGKFVLTQPTHTHA